MGGFKYELHAHTSEGSRCATIPAAEMVQFYKDRGYTGICITDHFLNGNTTVPRDLGWAERIELYCHSYECARQHGEKIGLDVFFGWEYGYMGSDFLTFGLDKTWLLNHPDLLEMSVNDYFDLVRREGAFVVHAHPFREAVYIKMIRLFPRQVDGVEVVNANRKDFENDRAGEYAAHYNLLPVAASDNHRGLQKRLAGIRLQHRAKDLGEIIGAIKAGEAELFTDYLPDYQPPPATV
ncbi:MAG: histidinol phosphatase [Eubacteriales bacterium]